MPNLGIPLNVGTLAGCLSILMLLVDLATSKVKVYIKDSPTRDNTVQIIAMVFGALFALVIELCLPGVHDAPGLLVAAGFGVMAAIFAIGRYHITKTGLLDSQGAADLQGLLGAFQPAAEAPLPLSTTTSPIALPGSPGGQGGPT